MSLTTLPGRRTAGTPDPAEVITITIGGRTFRAGRRTAAHLLVTFAAFAQRFPDLQLLVAQACYNAGYEPSAGTHDGDGVLDFYVMRNGSVLASTDADYWAVQRFMRDLGWAIWFRHTGAWASRSSWHLHGASIGCPGPVGVFVPGQLDDYYRHTLGLKDQHNTDLDQSAFPGDVGPAPWPVGTPEQWAAAIDQTIFDYPAWVRDQEDNMAYRDWPQADKDALAKDVRTVVRAELDASIDDADDGRVENPDGKGPKAMSQGRLLWAIYRLLQQAAGRKPGK